jgi:hypothetical protein
METSSIDACGCTRYYCERVLDADAAGPIGMFSLNKKKQKQRVELMI